MGNKLRKKGCNLKIAGIFLGPRCDARRCRHRSSLHRSPGALITMFGKKEHGRCLCISLIFVRGT